MACKGTRYIVYEPTQTFFKNSLAALTLLFNLESLFILGTNYNLGLDLYIKFHVVGVKRIHQEIDCIFILGITKVLLREGKYRRMDSEEIHEVKVNSSLDINGLEFKVSFVKF